MINNFVFKEKYNIDDLLEIIRCLRSSEGCPWDIEQDHSSVKQSLIEEAYETVEAIDCNDTVAMCEELGDVLLQVVFHGQIAADNGEFDFSHIADGICKKLISRHPHVFGDIKIANISEVLNNWDSIKRLEKNQISFTDTLSSVPKNFPALMRADKVQSRATKSGFKFDTDDKALDKLSEELLEFKTEIKSLDSTQSREKFGDLLFSMVNIAKKFDINSEQTLNEATERFITRFSKVETHCREMGLDMQKITLWQLRKILDRVNKLHC